MTEAQIPGMERVLRQFRPICAREGCAAQATVMPTLLLYARPGTVPAQAQLNLPLCEAHKIDKAELLITDDGWRDLQRAFLAAGAVQPRRELTALAWRPIP